VVGTNLTLNVDEDNQSVQYKSRKPYMGWVVKDTTNPKVRQIVGPLETCKDFLHETLEEKLRTGKEPKVDLEATRIAIVFNLSTPVENLNKSIVAIKQIINVIEAKNSWKKSLITSIPLQSSQKTKNVQAFLFTGDKKYMLNMPALHSVLFVLRSLYTVAHSLKENTPTELIAFIDKLQKERAAYKQGSKKSEELTSLEATGDFSYIDGIKKAIEVYLSTLMREHDNLFKGLSLTDFYSKENTNKDRHLSYHGGFGLDALHTSTLYNKTFSERCIKLFNQGANK